MKTEIGASVLGWCALILAVIRWEGSPGIRAMGFLWLVANTCYLIPIVPGHTRLFELVGLSRRALRGLGFICSALVIMNLQIGTAYGQTLWIAALFCMTNAALIILACNIFSKQSSGMFLRAVLSLVLPFFVFILFRMRSSVDPGFLQAIMFTLLICAFMFFYLSFRQHPRLPKLALVASIVGVAVGSVACESIFRRDWATQGLVLASVALISLGLSRVTNPRDGADG